jgi:acyl carrier protein
MDAILERVIRSVLDLPVHTEINAHQQLERDLGIDSLFLMHIVVGVESEFGIELRAEDIGSAVTVGDLNDAVHNAART